MQCKAKSQPALNVLIVFSLSVPFKLFIDKSSDINMFLKPIWFLINLINFLECVTVFLLSILLKRDFVPFKKKKSFFAMTAHIIFKKIDDKNTVTHSKKLIKLIRNKIGFKNIIISDDLSMKSLKGTLKENTIKTFNAGCNLALHCNGFFKEMEIVGKNSPLIDKFILKKTSQFYKILS